MSWLVDTGIAIIAGFFLDMIIGDPVFALHPIRLVGRLVTVLEKALRKEGDTPDAQARKGLAVVVLTLLVSGGVAFAILFLCNMANRILAVVAGALICWACLSARDLSRESGLVFDALARGKVELARERVSMIVGRDTEDLDEEGIIKAAVETVAENTADGEVSPLFFLMVGGPVLGIIYKAANTLDSMIAHKNERYIYFGRAAAILDDILNFIPSRIAAYLMIAVSGILGYDRKNAVRIHKRDSGLHESPNSAQTESVCAGALNIQLAGDIVYGGRVTHKPNLGDDIKKIENADIMRANRLMMAVSYAMLALVVAIRVIIIMVLAASV